MEETATVKEGKVKRIFREIFYFLSSKKFLKNFAAMLLMLLLLLLLVHFGMKAYTQHGKSLQVPDFYELTVAEATSLAKKNKLKVIVNDSIWTAEHPAGVIIKQSPEPNAAVKKNRSIYLAVTKSKADTKLLPPLAGNDNFDYYQRRLKQMKIGMTVRKKQFNNKLEDKTILYLYVNDKRINADDLKRGVKVPQGSDIEAVITTRGAGSVAIPNLKCKTIADAEFLVTGTRLAVGSIIKDGTVTEGGPMYVWRQKPPYIEGNTLKVGSSVDLYVTKFRPSNCQ